MAIILIVTFLGAYLFQEKLIFFPEKLASDFHYNFPHRFEELNFRVAADAKVNALHFRLEEPAGVVFYSHGNTGSLKSWGGLADIFLNHGFELLIYDYRGFGKSTGKISEQSLYHDAEFMYNYLKEKYSEDKIIVYGRSIGTGVASYLASDHEPSLLILESPYYNLPDLVKRLFPLIPRAMVKYKLRNDKFIPQVNCPILIFHGTKDEVIYHGSSQKLQKLLKDQDNLISIEGGHHNDLADFRLYHEELAKVLN